MRKGRKYTRGRRILSIPGLNYPTTSALSFRPNINSKSHELKILTLFPCCSTPKVNIGKYSTRVFFTDKIRDWPFKWFRIFFSTFILLKIKYPPGFWGFASHHFLEGLLVLFCELLGQGVVLGPLQLLADVLVVRTHRLALDGLHQLILDLRDKLASLGEYLNDEESRL